MWLTGNLLFRNEQKKLNETINEKISFHKFWYIVYGHLAPSVGGSGGTVLLLCRSVYGKMLLAIFVKQV
jgi:hypothetical protein